jgi:hypothetical protein
VKRSQAVVVVENVLFYCVLAAGVLLFWWIVWGELVAHSGFAG